MDAADLRRTGFFMRMRRGAGGRMASLEAAARAASAARRFLETSRMLVRGGHPLRELASLQLHSSPARDEARASEDRSRRPAEPLRSCSPRAILAVGGIARGARLRFI